MRPPPKRAEKGLCAGRFGGVLLRARAALAPVALLSLFVSSIFPESAFFVIGLGTFGIRGGLCFLFWVVEFV